MASEHKESGNSGWVWATVVFGLLGVATAPMISSSSGGNARESQKTDKLDKSDDIFPTPSNLISKKMESWEDPFELLQEELKLSEDKPVETSLSEFIQSQIDSRGKNTLGRLVLLVKIVEGAGTDEGTETRRRHRHALELGMASAGYSMVFPERMSYVKAEYDFHHSSEMSSHIKIDVPIKLYKKRIVRADPPTEANQLALVLWLRNDHLGERPLKALSQIVQNIYPAAKTNEYEREGLVILGPSSSNQLTKMVSEHQLATSPSVSMAENKDNDNEKEKAEDKGKDKYKPTSLSMPAFFSSWKHGAVLMNSSCTASNAGLGFAGCQHQITLGESKSLRVAHVIGEDSLLIKRLVDELELRGRNTRIVLFVEEQSQNYIAELKDSFTKRAKAGQSADDVVIIPYLRGISKTDEDKLSVADYLARTFSELNMDRAETVSAVGVFGTNSSDKIAIFRAARSTFPTAAFFTTELDARYSQPENYNACRNLLVASHYGLTCETKLFGGSTRVMPTFRDGYQTSAYLASLIALDHFEYSDTPLSVPTITSNSDGVKQDLYDMWSRPSGASCNDSIPLQPLVFEVSRLGNFQFPINDLKELQHRSVVNSMDRPRLFDQYNFLPRLLTALLLILAICLVTRIYSSELERGLNSAGLMLRAVRKFFSRTLWYGWQGIKRLIASRSDTSESPDLPDTPPSSSSAEKTPKDTLGFVIWFVAVISSTFVLGVIACISDMSPDGEPVTLADSISIWPSVVLFHSVSCISCYLILRYAMQNPDVTPRGLALAALLAALIVSAMGISVRDVPPARGEVTRTTASISLRTAATCLFVLASLSSLSILKARKEISAFNKAKSPRSPVAAPRPKTAKLSLRAETLLKNSSLYHKRLLLAMKIGKESSVTLIAPAALTIVLAVARLPLLDSWGLPRVWYVALMTPMLLSVVAALLMRSEAKGLKSAAIEKLEKTQARLLKRYAEQKLGNTKTADLERQRFNDYMEKVEYNISLVNRLNRGPFSSVYNDPLLGGLLLIITAGLTGPMREQTISLLSFLHIV